MNVWITKITAHTLLLCNLLFGINYVGVNQDTIQTPPVATPIVEHLASVENVFPDWKKEDFQRYYDVIKDTHKLEGLFTLYHRKLNGEVYLELKPDQLEKNYLATVTIESGIGESGIYSGMTLQNFLFSFRRVNNNLHFVVRNVKFRTDPELSESKAIARSFSDSVLYSLDIASIEPHGKSLLVNLGDLLLQDFPGLTYVLKYTLQANYRLAENKSYFGKVNSFPNNVEIDSIYGFYSEDGSDLVSLADTRALSLQVHYSFSELPENNGYVSRIASDKVGYFITAYQQFSHNNPSAPFVRYINRWHLEPKEPNAALSEPKKPIVFWIENAVPLEYRDAIAEGVLMWNKAFEKAGFKNAIQVRQMPDDADWQPADARYNTIRWFNSLDANFARGMFHANPLTGQILDADIIVDANMVRSIQKEYDPLVEVNLEEKAQPFPPRLQQILAENYLCERREFAHQAAMGAMALSLLKNVAPNSEKMQEYLHQYLRSLIAHEVGHTLGLRHNFHGSTMLLPHELNHTEITHTKGLVSSVMDYLPVNLAPPGETQGDYFPAVIGPYDEWAIQYGYQVDFGQEQDNFKLAFCPNFDYIEAEPRDRRSQVEPGNEGDEGDEGEKCRLDYQNQLFQPEFAYATDEDIWDINPDANLWDLSGDVLLYSQWQMDNARRMWQRLENGDSAITKHRDRRVLFDQIFNYYFLNANLLTRYIGGQSFKRDRFIPATLEKQRQVLTKLQDYVFSTDAFSFSPELLNQLAPSRWSHWGNPVPIFRLDYPIHSRILRFQTAILRSLLDGERLHRLQDLELKTPVGQSLSVAELFERLKNSVWTELSGQKLSSISSIRRSLQREHLKILLAMVLRQTDVPEDGRTLAWYQLRRLQTAIKTSLKKPADNLDLYTQAHLEETSDRITKALNAPLQSK